MSAPMMIRCGLRLQANFVSNGYVTCCSTNQIYPVIETRRVTQLNSRKKLVAEKTKFLKTDFVNYFSCLPRKSPLQKPDFSDFYITCRNHTHLADRECWKCGRKNGLEEELFFCRCGVVQSVTDVNFFQLMGIEQTYDIDTVLLSRRLKDLQKLLHPDKYTLKSEEEKKLSEQQSSTVNKAYSTLLSPLSRALYLLELHGQPLEEDNSDVNQEFLMEIMEINEQLAEIDTVNKMKQFEEENNGKLNDCYRMLSQAFRKDDITEAKKIVIELKYYVNIEGKIKAFYQENLE